MNFLIIRYSSLGDVVLATSVIKNIRANRPDCRIDFLTKDLYKPAFLNNPSVNDVFSKYQRDKRYDYVIDLHDNLRSNLACYFISAAARLKYNNASYERRKFLYTGIRDKVLDKSVIDRYLEPLEKIGLEIKSRDPEMFLTKEELKNADSFAPEAATKIKERI